MPNTDILAMSAAELRRERRRLIASERDMTERSNEFARYAKNDSVRRCHIESRLEVLKKEARHD